MGRNLKTVIKFYQGAYGSTVRIDVQNREWLEYFKDCISHLVEGRSQEFEIDRMDNVEITGFKSLKLVLVQHERYQKISIENNKEDMISFTWFQDIEELITVIGLIDGLLDAKQPGHQYLTEESDNVLIVLAHMEHRPEV
ncbi:MAG: hypothetical protein FWD03_02975 [Defluviitaleaceae bacterium]|nr:hypothetical protein [Defluviitaleaceae bacterium]